MTQPPKKGFDRTKRKPIDNEKLMSLLPADDKRIVKSAKPLSPSLQAFEDSLRNAFNIDDTIVSSAQESPFLAGSSLAGLGYRSPGKSVPTAIFINPEPYALSGDDEFSTLIPLSKRDVLAHEYGHYNKDLSSVITRATVPKNSKALPRMQDVLNELHVGVSSTVFDEYTAEVAAKALMFLTELTEKRTKKQIDSLVSKSPTVRKIPELKALIKYFTRDDSVYEDALFRPAAISLATPAATRDKTFVKREAKSISKQKKVVFK